MPGSGCLDRGFRRIAEISGPMFQKVSGDAIPFSSPKTKRIVRTTIFFLPSPHRRALERNLGSYCKNKVQI